VTKGGPVCVGTKEGARERLSRKRKEEGGGGGRKKKDVGEKVPTAPSLNARKARTNTGKGRLSWAETFLGPKKGGHPCEFKIQVQG